VTNDSPTKDEVADDCADGCDHRHKWEITPHPYRSCFDVFVTDSDEAARSAVMEAAEMQWDDCAAGEERTIKVRHNKVLP
jgi:hypothetical protein